MFIARGWVLNPLQGECWKILSLGIGLENPVSRDRIGQYYPAGRDGHQIHPRRVELIDSVKINPSLVMMRECSIILHPTALKHDEVAQLSIGSTDQSRGW